MLPTTLPDYPLTYLLSLLAIDYTMTLDGHEKSLHGKQICIEGSA